MSLNSPCTAPSLQNRDPNTRAEKHNDEGDRLFKAEKFIGSVLYLPFNILSDAVFN